MRRAPALASALALLLLAGSTGLSCAAAPALVVPDAPLSVPGAGLPVNLLLNFAVTFEDAGAAYRGPYQASRRYAGYFNARLCYGYPVRQVNGIPTPDLDERSGYFAPVGPADERHECRAAFSGNFLNWASASTLDLLRYGLTGGARVIDESGTTVLQRAWLPDGRFHADFYAHPDYFPRKVVPFGLDSSAPPNVTPFATDKLYIVSCRNRLLFSNSGAGRDCDAARLDPGGQRLTSDKFFGEFNARVQVCGAEDAALRPDLCAPYRNGYKPQGVLQGASQPLGVMGYLSEADGGGLRAPIKALGPDAERSQRAGPGAEWDRDTGVLLRNPDRAAGELSGALAYLNHLGHSNALRLGAYSADDPGAELYYEALRYLQGRPASQAAGPAVDDRLPVWRAAPDPILAACQRNIVATIGHAAFSRDRFVPGNTVTGGGDAARAADTYAPSAPLDVMAATRRVGELEAAGGAMPGGPARLDSATDGPTGAGSYYLAGAAHWAHINPIRADKPVRVDSLSLQLGPSSRPPESALYYAAKYGAFDDRNQDADPNPAGEPGAAGSEWADASGKPRHFYPAVAADDIIPAVRALFAGVGAHGGVVAGPSAVGGAGDSRYLIQTGYDAAASTGSLHRRTLRVAPQGAVEIAEAPAWNAAALLGSTPAPAERAIYTLLRSPGQLEKTVPFKWPALPLELRAWFDQAGGARDGLGQARVDYLRGERTLEAGVAGEAAVLRRRDTLLGDIVNSVPLIVGAPSAGIQGAGYSEFRERSRRRAAAVYVGANDGMLHAFDAASGRELFAYVPHALLPALAQLSSPAYRHRAYVDGSPGQGEAQVRGRWRSVLASGMGMGARGLFALDVSDPAAFGSGMGALWEFTDADDPAIGHIATPPQIVKLKVGERDGVPEYRYFVVTTSGINPAAASGHGALFLLALDKPPEQAWQLGLNYYKFITPPPDGKAANALAPPALALAGDGSARHAYAGDLQGRLWRFDLGGAAPSGGSLDSPVFIARDADGLPQPIAHAPALVFAPGGGYLVMFATGKFIEQSDTGAASFTPQSFYAVHDRLDQRAEPLRRGALAARTLSGRGPYRVAGKPVTYAGPAARRGWYLDFPNTAADGERGGGQPVVNAGAVLFETLLPGTDSCTAPAHRSYLLDALSGMALGPDGGAHADAATGALAPADGTPTSVAFNAPLVLEIGTSSAARNATGGALATRRFAVVRLGGPDGAKGASVRQVQVAFAARRLSWREVSNWQDLHDKAKARP